jgi:hypothetical protein
VSSGEWVLPWGWPGDLGLWRPRARARGAAPGAAGCAALRNPSLAHRARRPAPAPTPPLPQHRALQQRAKQLPAVKGPAAGGVTGHAGPRARSDRPCWLCARARGAAGAPCRCRRGCPSRPRPALPPCAPPPRLNALCALTRLPLVLCLVVTSVPLLRFQFLGTPSSAAVPRSAPWSAAARRRPEACAPCQSGRPASAAVRGP